MTKIKHYDVMLAKDIDNDTRDIVLKSKDYIFELKYDGRRALFYYDKAKVRIVNRGGIDISYRYPELTKIKLHCKNAVIDGEIVAFDKEGKISFSLLEQREHLSSRFEIKLKSRLIPVMFICFDVLFVNDKEVIDRSLKQRKELLNKIVEDSDLIRKSVFSKDSSLLYEITKEQGMEGIMAKVINSNYLPGKRSNNWLKIKHFKSVDCIVFFYSRGKGSRRNTFGALGLGLVKEKKLRFVGRVGSGFDESMLKLIKKYYLKDEKLDLREYLKKYNFELEDYKTFLNVNRRDDIVFIKPFVAEIKYLEFTKELLLREPVFIKIRNDKKKEECILPKIG